MPTRAPDHFYCGLSGSAFGHFLFVGVPAAANAVPICRVISEFVPGEQGGNNLIPGQISGSSETRDYFACIIWAIVFLAVIQKFVNTFGFTVDPCSIAQLVLQSQFIHFIPPLFRFISHVNFLIPYTS
jgi:hypothetical protein